MTSSPNMLVCLPCGGRGESAADIPHDHYCPGRVFAWHIQPLVHTGFGAGAI